MEGNVMSLDLRYSLIQIGDYSVYRSCCSLQNYFEHCPLLRYICWNMWCFRILGSLIYSHLQSTAYYNKTLWAKYCTLSADLHTHISTHIQKGYIHTKTKTNKKQQQTNSMDLAHEQTIPTEWPLLVSGVSAIFEEWCVTWSVQRISTAVFSAF
jgi:hypothetical protein